MQKLEVIGCDETNDPRNLEDRPSLKVLKNNKNLIGAEIGVRWGCNILRMIIHLDIEKIYLVDPYEPFPVLSGKMWMDGNQQICNDYLKIAEHNLQFFSNKIEWIKEFSYNSVDKFPDELDFIYIDGDHRKEAIQQDIELFYPKVKSGGMLAGHDFISTPECREGILESEIIKKYVLHSQGDDWWIIK